MRAAGEQGGMSAGPIGARERLDIERPPLPGSGHKQRRVGYASMLDRFEP